MNEPVMCGVTVKNSIYGGDKNNGCMYRAEGNMKECEGKSTPLEKESFNCIRSIATVLICNIMLRVCYNIYTKSNYKELVSPKLGCLSSLVRNLIKYNAFCGTKSKSENSKKCQFCNEYSS